MFVICRSFSRRITGQCCDVVVTASFPFLWVPPNTIILLHSVPYYRSTWCCLQQHSLSYLIPSVHSDYMCISLDGAWLRQLIHRCCNLLWPHYNCAGCVGIVCCFMSLTAGHFGNSIAQISSFFEDSCFLRCDMWHFVFGRVLPDFQIVFPRRWRHCDLRNIGNCSPNDTSSHTRRLASSATPLSGHEISQRSFPSIIVIVCLWHATQDKHCKLLQSWTSEASLFLINWTWNVL